MAVFCFDSSAQALAEVEPETQQFSRERLYRIDHMVKEYIDTRKMIGAGALIARNGKIVYYRSYGWDDRENKKPLKRNAIFRIA